MAGINKVILVGNLGRDPEIRYTQNGIAVCSFSLATSESYKDRTTGERVTQTEWHNIIMWRGLAETAEKYLRKGSSVYIDGKIRTRKWEDQQGQTRYTTEIVTDTMQMLDRRDNSTAPTSGPVETQVQSNPAPETPTQPAESPSQEPDDLPF
tara:strand:+ start:1089 stop:1544 length:456 start_codon:yes stop_codon:yes gene_type:complete